MILFNSFGRLKNLGALFILIVINLALPNTLKAQINNSTLSVFLDCRDCNSQYVRSEIEFVNFVVDQSAAEVQLLITRQRTGIGGSQFTLHYIGLGEFAGKDNQIIFISPQDDTNELARVKLVKYIKLGLIYYLSEKEILADLNIDFVGDAEVVSRQEKANDPWKGWNFEVGLGANISGEETRERYRFNGNFRAERASEKWRVRLNYWQNYNNLVDIDEDSTGKKIRENFINEEQNVFGLIARSLSDHWTVGAYFRGQSSTEDNYDLRYGATPAIEYSIFPYREFNTRELTIRYGVLAQQNFYTDSTIFGEVKEFRFRQELAINSEFTQPWGEIDGRIEIGNYLHDLNLRRINFDLGISMRISRFFSFFVDGNYSLINDQLNISGQGLSEAERLLNLRAQRTSYDFGLSFGFEVNFGSVYNNVINTRF